MNKTVKIALISSVLALFSLTASSPALAHDELISTSPSADSSVQAGLSTITLHFSEAPMDLGFGKGNLIAVADTETGEQFGAACAHISGSDLSVPVDLAKSGKYKVIYRVASDDGHIASGDFYFNVENTTNYQTENPGTVCVSDDGIVVRQIDQEPVSTKQSRISALEGLFIGIGFIVVGSIVSAVLIRRRQNSGTKQYD